MATPTQFTIAIKKAKNELIENTAKDALLSSLDMLALVKLRVQTRGKDFEEKAFRPYSARRKAERQDRGAQTDFVDFTLTGRLWNNIQPIVKSESAGEVKIVVGATSADNEEKLLNNLKYRPLITRPTLKEILILRKIHEKRRFARIKNLGR